MCESVGVAAVKSVTAVSGDDACQWFVMRDLTRPNAKLPAYKLLDGLNIRTFTPMVWKLMLNHGKRERRQMPFIHDLLFVYSSRSALDSVVETTPMLQYRYLRGGYKMPMTVRAADMQRFIHAVGLSSSPQYYRPDEVTPSMRNRRIRIIGGNLDGYEGSLITTRGSKVKRLLVEIPMLLAATVEVETEFIQLL